MLFTIYHWRELTLPGNQRHFTSHGNGTITIILCSFGECRFLVSIAAFWDLFRSCQAKSCKQGARIAPSNSVFLYIPIHILYIPLYLHIFYRDIWVALFKLTTINGILIRTSLMASSQTCAPKPIPSSRGFYRNLNSTFSEWTDCRNAYITTVICTTWCLPVFQWLFYVYIHEYSITQIFAKTSGSLSAIFFGLRPHKNIHSISQSVLKVNWNAETSWPLSRDFEAQKTVSKEFLKNSFSFSRYGPLKSSFLRLRRKDGKICAWYRESHAKEPWCQTRSLGSLHLSTTTSCALCQVMIGILQISLEYGFIE